jgi:hypothetical protein
MDEGASPLGETNVFGLLGLLFATFNYNEKNVFKCFTLHLKLKKTIIHTHNLVENLGCSPTCNYWKPNVDARNPLMLLLEITP